jgi:hypothetical protein
VRCISRQAGLLREVVAIVLIYFAERSQINKSSPSDLIV